MRKSEYFYAFLEDVRDLLASPVVQMMGDFPHHGRFSCLEHSISVAYGSYLMAKRLGWNARAAARGGLLHDLFLYDWRVKGSHRGLHGFTHPRAALEMALNHFELTPLECECILAHMFPMGWVVPRHGESIAVCLVDKACAIVEFLNLSGKLGILNRVWEIRTCPAY